jgi:hypothetical protein
MMRRGTLAKGRAPAADDEGMGTDPQAPSMLGPRRWLAVGHAQTGDPTAAAEAAVGEALAGGSEPRLLLAFAAASYDLPALARALADAAPGVPLVGCTTAGELTAGGAHDDSLVVAALGGPGFSVSAVAIPDAAQDLRVAGVEAAAALGDVADRPYRCLLLLSDALTGDQQELVRGAYSVAGAGVPLIGACAGDGLRMRRTDLLHDGRAHHGAVVAAAIGSDAPLGIGVRHGWHGAGEPLHVTRTEGAAVLSLDGRPALDVYLERLEASEAVGGDVDAFARLAHGRPLGLRRRAGEEHVRLVIGADVERRALRTAAEVPQGGLAWLMEHDAAGTGAATFAACAEAVSGLEGRAPIGLVAFGAAARRSMAHEPAAVARHAAGAPVAGFYGYGEIARVRGVTGFHNQALAVLAVA